MKLPVLDPEEGMRVTMALRYVPDGARVTKVGGQSEFIVRDRMCFYERKVDGESGVPRRLEPLNCRFLVPVAEGDTNVSLLGHEVPVVWLTDVQALHAYLGAQLDAAERR